MYLAVTDRALVIGFPRREELHKGEAEARLTIPVAGVREAELKDTWGALPERRALPWSWGQASAPWPSEEKTRPQSSVGTQRKQRVFMTRFSLREPCVS